MTTLYHSVSGPELLRHLSAISSTVRLSGTREEAQAFDYAERELSQFGYSVNRYESDALISYPMQASLVLLDNHPVTISVNGYSMSPSTGPDGIVGELLYVYAGSPNDYEDIDASGKIVISDGLATPGKAIAAAAAGAIGQIHINDEHIHEMCISPVWGSPTPQTLSLLPTIPAVGVDREYGVRILDRLRKGRAEARLTTEPFRAWVPIPTLTADLPGSAGDDFVLFSGHVDSWHYGVMDNGTANATQLEVARLLAERRNDLARGIRLAFWSGHSHGRYAGSTWYADEFWPEIHDRCACHVNIDSVGAKGATILDEAPTMAETYAFGRTILSDTVGAELSYRRISRSSDQSFWGHGVPSLFASLSEQEADESATGSALAQLLGGTGRSGGLGWWWHTTEDTAEKIDPDFLVRDAGVYAETLWRLCTSERLPFDPAAGAREIASAVRSYADAAGMLLDLVRTVTLAEEVAEVIDDSLRRSDRLDQTNRKIHSVLRALIPVNYTRSGPFDHDLALATPPVPGLSGALELAVSNPDSDDFHVTGAKLVRERNRVEAALRQAAALVES
jgi:hypothetical protein